MIYSIFCTVLADILVCSLLSNSQSGGSGGVRFNDVMCRSDARHAEVNVNVLQLSPIVTASSRDFFYPAVIASVLVIVSPEMDGLTSGQDGD